MLDATSLADADRWDDLIEQILAVPSPYRAAPGSRCQPFRGPRRPGRAGEPHRSLADLVITILEQGDPGRAGAY
jgi:hypothetical protein